jgi:hypothetical protein
MSLQKIVFVYNADSGVASLVKDFIHRIVSPETYPCNLCAVTYGNFGMKGSWRSFVENLEVPVVFLHKDEFSEAYEFQGVEFPSAFMEEDGNLEYLITADEMDTVESVNELKTMLRRRLDEQS